jgi:hypothetical protein
MASQLISKKSSESSVTNRASVGTIGEDTAMMKLMKSYEGDRLLEYLHLQAEVEVLLQQLQTLAQKKQEITK